MKKRKRKIKLWVLIIRIFILVFLIFVYWQKFYTPKPPNFKDQILDSIINKEASGVDSIDSVDIDDNVNLEQLSDNKNINSEDKKENKDNKKENKEDVVDINTDIKKNIIDKENLKNSIPELVILDVPFTSQAPFAEWDDDRFQDGCEEASVIMAMSWVNNTSLSKEQAKQNIISMSTYESDNYDNYHDTNASDTVSRLFNGYYNYNAVRAVNNVSVSSIKQELYMGNLVLVPTNGRLLNNPYYTAPGPETHMLVIKGFDPTSNEFITNDPGTRRGESYRYNVSILVDSILDYPTGNHKDVVNTKKAMIIVEP